MAKFTNPSGFELLVSCSAAAVRNFRRGMPLVLLTPLADLLFFITLGLATAPLFDRIIIYAQAYFSGLAGRAPELLQDAVQGNSAFPLNAALLKLALLYLTLLITIYVVYTLFQGLAWGFAARASRAEISPFAYLKRFARANLLWVPLYGILHLLSLLSDFQASVSARMGIAQPKALLVFIMVSTLLLLYFAVSDYALLTRTPGQWRRITGAFRMLPRMLPLLLFLGLIFFAINAILTWIFTVHPIAGIVGGLVLVLPMFLFFRLSLLAAAEA